MLLSQGPSLPLPAAFLLLLRYSDFPNVSNGMVELGNLKTATHTHGCLRSSDALWFYSAKREIDCSLHRRNWPHLLLVCWAGRRKEEGHSLVSTLDRPSVRPTDQEHVAGINKSAYLYVTTVAFAPNRARGRKGQIVRRRQVWMRMAAAAGETNEM